MYEPKRRPRDIAPAIMVLFRIGLVIFVAVVALRLYQLQVRENATWNTLADDNRFQLVEQAAPRGVVYDFNGNILARNRPSFAIALVPEDIPEDDTDTPIDEEAAEIERILRLLNVDTNTELALRVAEIMFRQLGRADFQEAVESVGVPLSFVSVPGVVESAVENPDNPGVEPEEVPMIEIPDISKPLPIAGLVALIKERISLQRLGGSSTEIVVLDLLEQNAAFQVSEELYRLPGVRVNPVPVREYVNGTDVSHILGFMGPIPAALAENYRNTGYTDPNERVGLSGLEYSYQTELRGHPGYANMEVDILGREIRKVGQELEPVAGSNLVLGIDVKLQQIMREALQKAMDEQEAKWGVTIAMDPMTGLVKGMVSLPTYDNNIFAEGINEEYLALEADDRRPLINYAIGGLYPPGSTFKITTATAGLEEGVIDPNTLIVDSGPLMLPNRYFPDDMSQAQRFVSWNHKNGGVDGAINVTTALARSNNIFFYEVAGGYPPTNFEGLGPRRLSDWAERMGYGGRTGIDLPGEVGITVANDQWKRQLYAESWTTGDSYNMGIGQGFMLATPLQVLVASAAIASEGKVMVPQVVYQVTDANGGLQRDFTPQVARDLELSQQTIDAVKVGMWQVVNAPNGTGQAVKIPGVELAGKTGTAEFCEYIEELQDCRKTADDNWPTHAWFVAYGPYENPEIAILTFVYDGGEGSGTALPIAKEILERYFTEISPIPETVEALGARTPTPVPTVAP